MDVINSAMEAVGAIIDCMTPRSCVPTSDADPVTPVAVAMTLQALRAADLPLPQGLQQEAALFAQCVATDDFMEGVGAFLNREKPTFQGR